MDGNNNRQLVEAEYEQYLSWRIPEYEQHKRGVRWYLISGIVVLILAALSVFTPNFLFDSPNFLFLIIIVLSSIILVIINAMPDEVDVVITSEGILIGERFYDYDELANFSVLFKPRENLKVLYLEFKAPLKPRLQIPLGDHNPIEVREILSSFLNEDLERTDESNVDFLSKLLKF
jgi:hypothetical protein